MKHITLLVLCIFLISLSVTAFAADPSQVKPTEQKMETEAAEKGEMIKEAKELPSTLITDQEERSKVMQEVEELREGYVYEEDPHAE
jgi:sensor histidine kinase regulating citrate/malate metabolism